MTGQLMTILSRAFSEPGVPAFAAAAAWGIISVILSPCHLGSLPLIVGYINNRQKPDRRSAFRLSLFFGLGLMVMLAVIGLATSAAGRLLGDLGPGTMIAASVFLIVCGLWLMDVPPLSRISFSFKPKESYTGIAGAFFLGLVYGVVLGPCSFAFMAPMIGFVFSAARSEILFGFSLMIFYAVGHTAVIIAAGTFGDAVGRLLQTKFSGNVMPWFKRILGALVVLAAVYQLISVI